MIENDGKENIMNKKRIYKVAVAFLLIALFAVGMVGCASDDCSACGGSGYYQKKDCPFC